MTQFIQKYLTYIILLLILIFVVIFYILTSQNTNLKEPWRNILNIKKYPNPILGFKDNVLSKKECKELMDLADNICEPSIVGFNNKLNKSSRYSYHGWVDHDYSPLVEKITLLCERLSGVTRKNFEKFQFVWYPQGGYYKYHLDSCNKHANDYKECIENGNKKGFRWATILFYLNEDFTGGSTHFPNIDCDIPAKQGRCIMFKNLKDNTNESEEKALHAGMDVKSGKKYVCNVWIRNKEYV